LFSISCLGQNLSTTARIKDLIKVWGFLKYDDPSIATGNIDWDSVFIKHVSKIIVGSEILAVICN